MREHPDQETSFGFRTVREADKGRLVRGVFDSVASRYDLMNDLMSGGVHRIWKSILIDRINPRPGDALLDMAGGTGDIAERFLARAEMRRTEVVRDFPETTAVICDVNHEMLKAGGARGARTSAGRLMRVCGDAETVPLPEQSVDAYTIAFGIRNVTHIDRALNEARRVLKYGGRFACLEFSHPVTDGLQAIYDRYSFSVIPQLGEWVANDRDSYQYLVESIRRFPTQLAFLSMIEAAGFSRARYENLTGGIAAIHMAWRL